MMGHRTAAVPQCKKSNRRFFLALKVDVGSLNVPEQQDAMRRALCPTKERPLRTGATWIIPYL